ncbi:MAG: ribose 1,5-bisphosphate isomerase [Elusimicrobia bacterium HGW-Elusimicrobia-2]|nr:MAG: ribose 1,5-bisphosphate isomerase [Elusimicrobia bacterium HGW-Elusimicrobia-2]
MLDEIVISRSIIESYSKKFLKILDVDVAVVGAGPSGLVCAAYLAKKGFKIVLFEKKFSIGGGMWAGGMMFNEIVVQEPAKKILDDFGIKSRKYKKGYYLVGSVECVCALGLQAARNGVIVMNGIFAEDVMVRKNRITGLVINWSAVDMGGLHVDPLSIRAKAVVDATGHPCEVAKIVAAKSGMKLKTKSGGVLGEKSMWAEVAENTVEKNTMEVAPGFFVCGMAANAVCGSPRMGPVFGGMLLSGRKAADIIAKKL